MIIGMAEITRILEAVQQGDLQAAAELFPLVYEEMRKVASQKMAHEAPGHTLQSTELVHEAWLRLAGSPSHEWQKPRSLLWRRRRSHAAHPGRAGAATAPSQARRPMGAGGITIIATGSSPMFFCARPRP